uniref:Expressed protein n=2 Tax=Schizophyllum commune (strain H4-8 / FGSC 9210) TaxID=578458 RepID=D8PL36_SCHCM
MVASDTEDAEFSDGEAPTEETASVQGEDDEDDEEESAYGEEDEEEEEDDDYNEDEETEEEEEEWEPAKTPKAKAKGLPAKGTTSTGKGKAAAKPKGRVTKLAEDLDTLSIAGDADEDMDDILPLPPKKGRGSGATQDSVDELDTFSSAGKKKRQLGKNRVLTEDEIEQASWAAEHQPPARGNIRRLTMPREGS